MQDFFGPTKLKLLDENKGIHYEGLYCSNGRRLVQYKQNKTTLIYLALQVCIPEYPPFRILGEKPCCQLQLKLDIYLYPTYYYYSLIQLYDNTARYNMPHGAAKKHPVLGEKSYNI